MGASAGLTLRYVGGVGISCGSWRCAAEMAAWTSWAAPSMLRSSENVTVIVVEPSELDEVIESMPATVESCDSSGVATDDAIVSGEAPGNDALMLIVGKSTLGNSFTGNRGYAAMPKMISAAISNV